MQSQLQQVSEWIYLNNVVNLRHANENSKHCEAPRVQRGYILTQEIQKDGLCESNSNTQNRMTIMETCKWSAHRQNAFERATKF